MASFPIPAKYLKKCPQCKTNDIPSSVFYGGGRCDECLAKDPGVIAFKEFLDSQATDPKKPRCPGCSCEEGNCQCQNQSIFSRY